MRNKCECENLPVSFVSLVAANPFFGLTASSAFVLAAFVSVSGVAGVSGVFALSATAPLAAPLINFLMRYSLMDIFRLGVSVAGGKSLGGFNRGSALCVRVRTFGGNAVGVKFTNAGDGTIETGVFGSLNVEYDFVK